MTAKTEVKKPVDAQEDRPDPLSIIMRSERGPLAICINGQPGVGKTTFAFGAPKPIGILTERGMGDIQADHFPICKQLEHVHHCIATLTNNEHSYESIVVDSLDWLQELIFDYICRKYNCASIEDANGGYGKGYVEALREWRKLLDSIDVLRFNKGMHVIFTAHTEIRKVQDPRLPTYDSYAIKLNKRASAVVEEYCDIILFATWDIVVRETKDGGQKRTRALEDAPRIMHADLSPLYSAKNRYHLPGTLPLSWAALDKALKAKTV